MYTPNPINTDDVAIDEEIWKLAELLSRNTHEVWAAGRIAEGWRYGETRNDELKQTPCLVPYEELSDAEISYDLNTAMETIKVILKLGYKITK